MQSTAGGSQEFPLVDAVHVPALTATSNDPTPIPVTMAPTNGMTHRSNASLVSLEVQDLSMRQPVDPPQTRGTFDSIFIGTNEGFSIERHYRAGSGLGHRGYSGPSHHQVTFDAGLRPIVPQDPRDIECPLRGHANQTCSLKAVFSHPVPMDRGFRSHNGLLQARLTCTFWQNVGVQMGRAQGITVTFVLPEWVLEERHVGYALRQVGADGRRLLARFLSGGRGTGQRDLPT